MIENFVYKLPKDVPVSEDVKSRALGYFVVLVFGQRFYVPITKKAKKILGLKIKNGQFVYAGFDTEDAMEDMLRDIIMMMRWQVHQNVAAEVESRMMQEIRDGFDRMVRPKVEEILEKHIVAPALLPGKEHKDGEKTT